MQQNFKNSVKKPAQFGALDALTDPGGQAAIAEMRRTVDRRRKLMLDRVRATGLRVAHQPQGAFYVFANARQYTDDSYAFAFDCLEKARVGVTPGIDFGSHGEGYLRLSYAVSEERIEEGLSRLKKYLDTIGSK